MPAQLKKIYGDKIQSEDLTYLGNITLTKPLRTAKKKMGKKTYKASYFGKQDISSKEDDKVSREFWRLENAYKDVEDKKIIDDVLPYNNYPMPVKKGQVFLIVYTLKDGSRQKVYYRSDGTRWYGMKTTVAFEI